MTFFRIHDKQGNLLLQAETTVAALGEAPVSYTGNTGLLPAVPKISDVTLLDGFFSRAARAVGGVYQTNAQVPHGVIV